MKYNIFISYAESEQDIVENLRGRFNSFGVRAWVYSMDKTLGDDLWREIKIKIKESAMILFVVSNDTLKSQGQKKELELTLKKIKSCSGGEMVMPIFTSGASPQDCPDELKYINGEFLDAYNVQTVAHDITTTVFPSLLENNDNQPWKIPTPGQWLEISKLGMGLESYFDVGDVLYFRALSPMGLLECYSPKTKRLFWISSNNVKPLRNREMEEKLEQEVPSEYTISGMINILSLGWDAWHKTNE